MIDWIGINCHRWPDLMMLYAIPNSGHRRRGVAGRLRAEGVRRGVPDLCLPVARGGAFGLYIEMKAPGGRESTEQRWWREHLQAQGYRSVVCVGTGAAIAALAHYLACPNSRGPLDRHPQHCHLILRLLLLRSMTGYP